jgi:hypothetical protein
MNLHRRASVRQTRNPGVTTNSIARRKLRVARRVRQTRNVTYGKPVSTNFFLTGFAREKR